MNKTIKIVAMLFIALILNTMLNADSSGKSTQHINKTEVEKLEFLISTYTPEFIKSLSDSQIIFHKKLLNEKHENIATKNRRDRRRLTKELSRIILELAYEEIERLAEISKKQDEIIKKQDEIIKKKDEDIKKILDKIRKTFSK